MDAMKEAMNRRKMRGLAVTITVEPQNAQGGAQKTEDEQQKESDLAPNLKVKPEGEDQVIEEQEQEGDEDYLADLPTDEPRTTNTLGTKVMAAMHRLKTKKGEKT